MENGREEERENNNNNNKRKKNIITIPSYEEVLSESSNPKPPPSLFTPSPSFSQAFSFIKNTEFYSAPPHPSSFSRQTNQPQASPSTSTSSSSFSLQNRNAILVSHRQKGNPLLKHIRNVKWLFADIICDYLLGQNSCALYLSLRYHLLHPDYLYYRIKELQKNFKLRVVLCHVDVEDVVKPILEVTKTALLHDCTLLCAWSLEECGRYLETIKVYENKPADILQGQMDTDYLSRLNHALTAVRRVNKTDVVTLGSNFGSLSRIMDSSMEDLARCPGIGEKKVKRLYDTFHEPFRRAVTSQPPPVEENHVINSLDDEKRAEKVAEVENKQNKDEPSLSIKSALNAAFAKYSDKVHKKKTAAEKGIKPSVDSNKEKENKRLKGGDGNEN
ncbi:hypothetical protein IFM89_015999 [Coptis chinensis]|uniref:DNA excision repair protein ERCC-1 n=1 Tax=Coptis chinensis TaxID=261450 RepID=A0A835LMH1_9MAGN|nr:hypothetical protein IFM89_015999 [Coptis chinensis]